MKNDFRRDLALSQEFEPQWERFYRHRFPELISMHAIPPDNEYQLKGVDRVLFMPGNRQLYVDEKIRTKDYSDVLLEIWSNFEAKRPGWAVDDRKISDMIAYAIVPSNTVYLWPYTLLRQTVKRNLSKWTRENYCRQVCAQNAGYTTVNIAIAWKYLFVAFAAEMFGPWDTETTPGNST